MLYPEDKPTPSNPEELLIVAEVVEEGKLCNTESFPPADPCGTGRRGRSGILTVDGISGGVSRKGRDVSCPAGLRTTV